MIEGTLHDCRRAAEVMIAKHAARENYTPAEVHEQDKDGQYKAVWTTPAGKMQILYAPTNAEADPLHVSDELLDEQRRRKALIESMGAPT